MPPEALEPIPALGGETAVQGFYGLSRMGRLFEQADEPGTDYHAGTVGIGRLTGGP